MTHKTRMTRNETIFRGREARSFGKREYQGSKEQTLPQLQTIL